MLNEKGPLMFINTVGTKVDDNNQQKVYDSRNTSNKKNKDKVSKEEEHPVLREEVKEPNILNISVEDRKLNNIIDMYHKNKPVLCNIILNKEEIVGTPYEKDNIFLYMKSSDESIIKINLIDIKDIVILKF